MRDDEPTRCEMCGETLTENDLLYNLGEFVTEDGEHVVGHADCGIANGYPIA